MASKTFTHGNHEHAIKVTKTEVLGLKIDDTTSDSVFEAFGWSDEKGQEVEKAFMRFNRFQMASVELYKDLPWITKNSVLADFLKSDVFKQLNVKLETPNDYFLMGSLFYAVLTEQATKNITGGVLPLGQISPKEMLDIIKGIHKNGDKDK